jgi:hypothetical protein
MPMTSPDRIVLTDTQRGDLGRLVRAGRTEQRLALRAGIECDTLIWPRRASLKWPHPRSTSP